MHPLKVVIKGLGILAIVSCSGGGEGVFGGGDQAERSSAGQQGSSPGVATDSSSEQGSIATHSGRPSAPLPEEVDDDKVSPPTPVAGTYLTCSNDPTAHEPSQFGCTFFTDSTMTARVVSSRRPRIASAMVMSGGGSAQVQITPAADRYGLFDFIGQLSDPQARQISFTFEAAGPGAQSLKVYVSPTPPPELLSGLTAAQGVRLAADAQRSRCLGRDDQALGEGINVSLGGSSLVREDCDDTGALTPLQLIAVEGGFQLKLACSSVEGSCVTNQCLSRSQGGFFSNKGEFTFAQCGGEGFEQVFRLEAGNSLDTSLSYLLKGAQSGWYLARTANSATDRADFAQRLWLVLGH